MAKKTNSKKTGRLLVRLGIVGYLVAIYVTLHAVQLDYGIIEFGDAPMAVVEHMFLHPIDVLPVNWEAVGIVSFIYALCMAGLSVNYEKQKNTRPGEENGSAQWNDDFEKFSAKYAEPMGAKTIEQKTGWIDKKTGLPWTGERKRRKSPDNDENKTTSFVVAIKNLIKRKIDKVVRDIKDKWLDVKASFHKKDKDESSVEVVKEPTARQRKRYEWLCALEEKLDMNLDKYKPKPCLEELRRKAEELKEKEKEDARIAELRRRSYTAPKSPREKLSPTLVPVNRNMILSQNVALSMDGRATRKNCNTLILGGSGAGKTRFYLKPNLMQLNCSYVITDPSGEILQTMGKFLENAGYEIKVINLTNMDQSHCYNPFAYVREDADILVMIDVLTKNLTPPDSHSSDPFWPKSQAALLQAICFYLYKECRPAERNFTNVMKLLRAAIIKDDGVSDYKSPLDIIFEDLEKKDPNHIAVMQYSIFKQAPAKTASTILTCAQVDLAPFNLDTIANLTGIDTVDMGTIGLKPTALFCITPTAKTTYNWIISLAYTQLFETLYYTAETQCKGLRLPVHVRFLLDEFANIGQIPDFEQKLSTMRKYEISCAIIIQNMAQLETMYKDSWKTIVGNCDEFIYLGGHESSSTEYVSKMLGKQTIKSRNSSRTYGRQGSNNISLNATGRELMTPDEIAHMSDQDCLVMVKGVMPFFDQKYDLTKHPNYKYTGDADENLLYDVAAEIRTPSSKLASSGRDEQYRHLQYEAKADARNHDRSHVIGSRRRSVTALNRENLENAGFNNCFDIDAGAEDEEKAPAISVVGSHVPQDEFAIDMESEEASQMHFDSFLGGLTVQDEVAAATVESSRMPVTVCFDVETTGTDPNSDEILQVSIIDGDGNILVNTFVKPRRMTSWPDAEVVHGISPETVEHAPDFSDLLAEIQEIFDAATVRIAYNGAVSRGFLEAAGVVFPEAEDVDVMLEFAPIYGELDEVSGEYRSQSLSTCAQHYHFDHKPYDSLEDAKAILFCYQQMQKDEISREEYY